MATPGQRQRGGRAGEMFFAVSPRAIAGMVTAASFLVEEPPAIILPPTLSLDPLLEMLRMGRVLLVIGDAAEVLDTFYPLYRIREDGHEVLVAAPAKRLYHLVLHEKPEGWDITRESPGYHLAADIAFADIRADEYHGLFLSGGRAPEYLRYDPNLTRVVRSFFARDLPVASVCHGIEILAAAGVLRGRTVTTVAKCQFDAEGGGASYVDQSVVVSGNLVTARTWHDNAPFMREFMKMLNKIAPVG